MGEPLRKKPAGNAKQHDNSHGEIVKKQCHLGVKSTPKNHTLR